MSRKLAQEYLKKGDNISTKVIFDNGKKFELNIKGDIKTMSDSGFSKKQLKQLQVLLNPIVLDIKELKQDIKEVKSRLDVLESFHKNDFDKLKSKNKK